MESSKPWLADFIKSSLDAWFGEVEGCHSVEYRFQKIDDKLKASYGAPCQKTVVLLKPPKLGTTEPRGEISDGIHKIEAIFTKGTAAEITVSGAQHGALLHLVDPVLRVTPHVNPPKPLLEIAAFKILDETDRVEQSFSSGCAVTEDQDVRERMSKYWVVKRRNRGLSTPASCGSPDSFKSQVDINTRAIEGFATSDGDAEDNEENVSQQPFCTQVPNCLSSWSLTIPSESTSRKAKDSAIPSNEVHFLPSPDNIQGLSGSADCFRSKQTQQPAPKADSGTPTAESTTPRNESLLLPSTTSGQGLRPAPRPPSRSTNANPSRLQVTPVITTDNDKSSPVEVSELGGNIQESPKKSADHNQEEPPSPSTKLSPGNRVVVPPSAEEPHKPFQRWRKEASACRYLPRHSQKIPRQQAKLLASLLDSGDSWQPPLVGRTQRPGEVPLPLLVQLSDAADKHASDPALRSKNVEPEISQDPCPSQDGQDQAPKSAHPSEGNESDSEEFAEWSQSPPTQQRRATRLPPSSPPPDLTTRQKRTLHLADSGEKEEIGMSSLQEPSLSSSASQERGLEAQSMLHDHRPLFLGPGSHRNAGPRSSAEEAPHSPQFQHTDLSNKSSSQEDTPSMVAELSDGSSSKKIQVTRTPYSGKGSNLPKLLASRITSIVSKKGVDDGNPTSTFVPGTYFESSSGVVTAIGTAERSIEAAPTDASSNPTPDSDHSLPIANFEPQVVDVRKLEDANLGKASSPNRNANLDNTLSSSASSQRKMEARPDQRDLPNSRGDSDGPGSRLCSSETTGEKVLDADMAAGGQDCDIVAGNSPGSPEKAAPGNSEKARGEGMTETREVISISAKRKRTNSGSSDVPTKKQRQEQEVTNPDPENVAVTKRAVEYREQRLPQVDRLEDSLRRPISPPPIATGRTSEVPVCEERRQRRLETSRTMDNPKASTRHSHPSSMADDDSSSGPMQPSPKQGGRHRQLFYTINAPRRSSTPITRQSSYGEVDNGEVRVMADEPGAADGVFARYRAAYPDYQGNADDFLNSYCFVKEIWIREPWPKSIHPSHLDDAVFHHFHSYQPYVRTVGTAAVGFVEFFHGFIEDPSHHKRIIRPSTLERLPSREGTLRRSTLDEVSIHQRSHILAGAPVPSIETAKVLTGKETIARQQRRVKCLPEAGEQAVEDRIDSIERWREEAAHTASPGLGTPDVERSLWQRTALKNESPEPAMKTSVPTTTPEPRKPPELSADLFVKPQKPVAEARPESVTANTTRSSSVRVKKRASTRRFWRGTSTAFTTFEQQYARLAGEKKGWASTETLGGSSSGQNRKKQGSDVSVVVCSGR
ncbi:hypothetical protein CLAIMM_14135 [Cladophialophora immunda]|nr:hypothetical protein CLAIMM_14135 [Cladophialophora immunda]